jgi:tetratricopeptide (TPR) repeat protein
MIRTAAALTLLAILATSRPRPATAPSWSPRVDSLLEAGRPAPALALLDDVLAAAPDDVDAHWRSARAAYQQGVLAAEPAEQNRWFRTGAEHARRALAGAPTDTDALRWSVAAIGSLADGKGIGPRETARLADETWSLIARLRAVSPDEPIAHYAAGFLQAKIMELNGLERVLARVALGGQPLARASWDDALRELRAAVALEPANILYPVRLGTSLAWHGERDEARRVLGAALALPVGTPLDAAYHAEGVRRLAALGAR